MVKRNNRNAYYAFIFLLYFFLLRDWLERQVSLFGYIDEIIALFGLVLIILKCIKKGIKYKPSEKLAVYVFVFVIFGLLGNLFFKYQSLLSTALPDMFVCLKFWLTIVTGKYLFSKIELKKYSKRIFSHVRFVILLFVILVIADNIFHIFAADIRYGLRSTQLFYYHTTVFGSCVILLMCVLLCIKDKIGKKANAYFIIMSILVCSTWRTRLIGSVVLFWMIWYLLYIRKKPFRIRTLLIFVPILLLVGWEKIQFYFNGVARDQSARYMLLTKSIVAANDHFPVGTGFGTFGSYHSSVVYSPLYYRYGLNLVFGLTPENSGFISDSFWPMALAQTGWIGLICYVVAIYKVFMIIKKSRRINLAAYFVGIFIMLYLLIESTAGSSFVHPLSMPFAIVLGYVINKSEDQSTKMTNLVLEKTK